MDKSRPSAAGASLKSQSKRQQVAKANKSIFVWVAVAAAVVALSLVALQFLVRVALFNNSIISQKAATNQTIVDSIANAEQLRKNVDALVADNGLGSIRASETDSALRVILDALPTTGDTTSLSNSLFTRVVGPSGVKIESVVAGSLDGTPIVALDPAAAETQVLVGPQTLPFSVGIVGDVALTKNALLNIEKTIRPMNVTRLEIKNNGGTLTTTINGETYFIPAAKVEIQKEMKAP